MLRAAAANCLLLLAFPAFALGDDPPKPPPVWSGKAEASYVATSGNSEAKTLGAAGEVLWVPGVWNYKAALAFIRSESDGVESARSLDSLLRAARKLSARFELYGQGSYRENTFAGIDHSWAGEAGGAYQFLSGEPHSLKAETGFGYTAETRLLPPTPPATDQVRQSKNFATARLGIDYKWKLSKNAELSDVASFTEDLNDSKDWRFGNTVALSASVVTKLSVKLSYAWLTLNEPVPGKKKTDTITSAALVAKF